MYLRSMLVAVATVAVLWAAPAFAEDLVFTVDNQTSGAIKELYVSTLNSDSWEEDILGQDVLDSGKQATITISNTNGICEFDMRLVYDDDSVTDERKINLCNLDDATYTVKD